MAVLYLDSSAVVKRYAEEVGSAWVTAHSDPPAGNQCWIAQITPVEILAALYKKVRTGNLLLAQAQTAAAQFQAELQTHFHIVALSGAIVQRAMGLIVPYPLRAYDALQLATALEVHVQMQVQGGLPPLEFLCGDADLNHAAAAEGLVIDDPNQHPP